MGDFHLPEVQQFPNSNATIGFKSNPIATSNRRYAKQSVFYSTVTVVFAKNYLKHSKVNGMCVKSTPVLAPLNLPFRSFDGHFFFFRSKWASKIEEKCVPLDYQRILVCMRVFPYMRMLHC